MCQFIMSLPLVTVVLQLTMTATFNPVIMSSQETVGKCPSREERENTIQNITASVQTLLQERYANNIVPTNIGINPNTYCGEGQWHQVANLNMSNSSQQCPSAWREYNSNGVRGCGRPVSSSGDCPGISFTTGRQYNKVCGRAIGYQIGAAEAFYHSDESIDSYYMYGLSITYGTLPRNHIWTLAAGISEGGYSSTISYNCPCADPNNAGNGVLPSFVGNNYYCESGNPSTSYTDDFFYTSDPLWDGEQCEGECCSNGKSPPWFSVELPNPTTDAIEVRICGAHGVNGDVAVQVLDIYIQ